MTREGIISMPGKFRKRGPDYRHRPENKGSTGIYGNHDRILRGNERYTLMQMSPYREIIGAIAQHGTLTREDIRKHVQLPDTGPVDSAVNYLTRQIILNEKGGRYRLSRFAESALKMKKG